MTASEPAGALARRLGLRDAVVVGLSSMIGAGVFSAFAPAARAAGAGLLLALVIAGFVAYCNATSSAQLAAVYPVSGGTYVYGRERLGEWWGFAAGWGFVVGKTASCAAMALTVGVYAVPGHPWVQRGIGVTAVLLLAALNCRGITKTAQLSRVLVAITLLCLAALVVGIWSSSPAHTGELTGWASTGDGGVRGLLQAAGLLFFAVAGYARIATLGEEVRDPARTIPRAISVALFVTLAVYALVAVTILAAASASGLASTAAPLDAAVRAAGIDSLGPVVRVGAVVSALGTLLALIAGVGRTSLAMARQSDLPGWLAAVHPRYQVPHHAEIALAIVVSILVLTVDLRAVIGFSSFGVLIYYAIANASAFTQPAAQRRWPRLLQVLGLVGCVVLVVSLPAESVVAGLAVFVVGLLGRVVVQRRRR